MTQDTITHRDVRPVRYHRHRFLATALLTLAAAGLVMSSCTAAPSSTVAAAPSSTDIRPFHVHVPEAALVDLRQRLAATRWPDQETVADPSQGVQLAKLQ